MISPSIFSLATAAASANLAARMWLTQGLTRELARGQVVYALIIFTCCVAALALSVWAHMDDWVRAVNERLDSHVANINILIDRFRVMDEAAERRRNSDAEEDAKMRRELNL